jgi:gliding motility-associated-like protein
LTATNTTPYLGTVPTYTYQWLDAAGVAIPGATNSTYTVNNAFTNQTSSDFSVVMTSTGSLACSGTSNPFTVLQSGQAVTLPVGSQGYTVTNAFSENQIITVTVTGYGTYEYSLDDGPRQESNVFENVGLGEHFITVWDTKGGIAISCDPLVINQVQTIDYPHYFTPNGDGIHDTWNISGLQNDFSAKIYIFDRFGKLIKQISPQSPGWDGTYNGNLMSSTDYWFTVDYSEAAAYKQFKAHFSLKR